MWIAVFLVLTYSLLASSGVPLAHVIPVAHVGPKVFTAVHPYGHNGVAKEDAAVDHDHLGGKIVSHRLHASNHDPFTGHSDIKHSQRVVHVNPFLGKAAVHDHKSSGFIDPVLGKAAFSKHQHESREAPGHAAVQEASSAAAVSPFGNSAHHKVYAARADHVHGGLAHNAQLVQSHHGINPWGAVSHHSVEGKHGFHGHGFGHVHHGAQATSTAFDHHGAEIKQSGHATGELYDAHVGLGEVKHLSFVRKAAHDKWGNYKAVSHATHVTRGGPLGHHVVVAAHPVHGFH